MQGSPPFWTTKVQQQIHSYKCPPKPEGIRLFVTKQEEMRILQAIGCQLITLFN
jgi:hypothetical protein